MTQTNPMNVGEFAQLMVTLRPFLQKLQSEGRELPPLEELLRLANKPGLNGVFLRFHSGLAELTSPPTCRKDVSLRRRQFRKWPSHQFNCQHHRNPILWF